MLIGQGPLMDTIKNKVNSLDLDDCVMFLGQKDNVNEYYNAMDLFLFPSLYEGLGMVLIEAQTNGLPCVVSSEVPSIAKVSKKFQFISLKVKLDTWIEIIKLFSLQERENATKQIAVSGFDINNETSKLEEYLEKRSSDE